LRRTGRTLAVALALLAFVFAGTASADDLAVSARVDKRTVSLNDAVRLSIIVEGTVRQVPTPKLPDLEESFSVHSSGSSTNFSMINGRVTSSKTWSFELYPKSIGTHTIGSAEVEFDGVVYRTDPIEIEVVEGTASATPGGDDRRRSTGVDSEGRDVFVTTSVSSKTAYVDEQITLSLKIYRRTRTWSDAHYELPDFQGFWVLDLPPQEEYIEDVDGISYKVIEVKTALFGTAAGAATIGPAALVYREERNPFSFFSTGGRQRRLMTDPIEVEILPLPATDRPVGYGGAVGNYAVRASLESEAVRALEPVVLTITIEGAGNIRTVPVPTLPDLPEFKIYESDSATDLSRVQRVAGGRKTFEYVLVPQTPGTRAIPPIELTFFDPGAGRYRTAATPALRLEVAEGDTSAGEAAVPVPTRITRLGRDIRYIREPREALERRRRPVHRTTGFLLAQFVPLVALAGVWIVRRRRDLYAGDEALARSVRAPGKARRELQEARSHLTRGDGPAVCASVARAVTDFVGDRFGFPARGMTLPALADALRERGAPEETVECVRELLGQCDLGRFAGGSGAVEAERIVASAEECLRALERVRARGRRRR